VALIRDNPTLEARLMSTFSSTIDTQLGPFTIVVDEAGAVLASGWTADVTALVDLIHADLREAPRPRSDVGAASRAAIAYHRGDLTAPDDVAVRQPGGGVFLPAAWQALRAVPSGQTVSYTELAARTGNPAAVRAAAAACARNAAALFIPCHRVLRADGTLGGFRWGVERKRALLDHEADASTVSSDGAGHGKGKQQLGRLS
jgi:methylated-DNA-[protein]-cysteine S-methyltransferase